MVDDQRGSPTYTPDLARHSRELVEAGGQGVFHLVNSGEASWFELASEAVRTAGIKCAVEPIPSSGYPQKARRPAYSVLSTKKFEDLAGVRPRPWEQAVREYVRAEIANK